MPVYRGYRMPNGERREFVDPAYERRYREYLVQGGSDAVNWRDDPTYDLRRKK